MPPPLPEKHLHRKKMGTANNWKFSESLAHYPVENCMIVPKVELDLDIFEINLKGQCAVLCIFARKFKIY